MNTTPFRTNGIEDPNLLFGRQEELNNLCDYAEGLHQVEIIGARRFGKTCLVKCFITLQKENPNRRVYPVYLDPYSDLNGTKGTTNVYRYLTSKIISNLLIDGYIDDYALTIDDNIIVPNKKWEKIFKQLENVSDEIDQICIFDETVEIYSEQIGQIILLIFDEYEKAVDAFDKIDGLLHLRQLSGRSSNPISFWIVGASPWKKFIEGSNKDVRGSGVFNGVTQNQNVCPLNLSDFSQMWKHECNLIPDESKRVIINSLLEKVYESSGGVPCFAKEIGATTLIKGDYPQYNHLSNHFAELEKNLTVEELKHLKALSSSPHEFSSSEIPGSIVELETYGLIKKNEQGRYYIPCRFFADYILAKLYDEKVSTTKSVDFITYVDRIAETIRQINEIWHNKYKKYMFDVSNNTQSYYKNLRIPCDNSDKFTIFINSIYLLYWEGAKENNNAGEKIPSEYKWTLFRMAMDRIRHVFGKAHEQSKLSTRYGQMNKQSALSEITGYSTEPETPEEWLRFQECMLKRLLNELSDIHKSITLKDVNGERSSGVIVEVSKPNGKIFKKVKSEISHHLLRIKNSNLNELHNGDRVSFLATQEIDPNNPLMTFLVAYEVKLE